MFFDPLTSWIVTLLANGIGLADEYSKNRKADKYLKEKETREAKKEFFAEPHRDPESGKIIIENNLLYEADVKKYGAYQAHQWVRAGKYNLSSKELEKENKRIEKKFLEMYELSGCLSPEQEKRLEVLRQSDNGDSKYQKQVNENRSQKEIIKKRLEEQRVERAKREEEILKRQKEKEREEQLYCCHKKNVELLEDNAETNSMDEIAEYVEYYIRKYSEQLSEFGYDHFKVEISRKLQSVNISIFKEKGTYTLKCRCFSDDLTAEINESAFCDIITFVKNTDEQVQGNIESQLVRHLEYKDFCDIRIAQGAEKTIAVFAYKNQIKYAITVHAEYLYDYQKNDEQILLDEENSRIDFDNMEGHQFEFFCAGLLEKNGYENVTVTQGSGDQGIDIIAYRDDIKYGIQCKCHSSAIGNHAVQEVFAGKTFYRCHIGIVLTNNYFTNSAIELANHNGIVLWNREKLLQMIRNS